MARQSFLTPIALVFLVLVVPGAQAGLAITVTGPDRGPEITPGESGSVEVEFSIATSGNIVCPQPGTVTLALRAGSTDDSLGLGGSMNPTSLSFEIPANAYTDTTGQFESETQTAIITMTVDAAKLPPLHNSHTLAAGATYDGGPVGTCQGDIAEGSPVSASHNVNFPIKQLPQEAPTAPTTPTNGGGTGGGNQTDDDDTEEGAAPGFFALGLVALAFVALRRRV